MITDPWHPSPPGTVLGAISVALLLAGVLMWPLLVPALVCGVWATARYVRAGEPS